MGAVLAVLATGRLVGLHTVKHPETIIRDGDDCSVLASSAVFASSTVFAVRTVGDIERLSIAQRDAHAFVRALHAGDHRSLLNESLQFLRHLLNRVNALVKVIDVALVVLATYKSARRKHQSGTQQE